jgi:hypothetical protein
MPITCTAGGHRPQCRRCGSQDADRQGWQRAPFKIAEVYTLRNDAKETFDWLDRAWSSHDPGVQTLFYDSLIRRFKGDPRFAAFCRKVGLPVSSEVPGLSAH